MDDISKKRYDKKVKAAEATVEETLEAALHELRTGQIKADRCMLVMIDSKTDPKDFGLVRFFGGPFDSFFENYLLDRMKLKLHLVDLG